jgi:hypothetical protein
MSMTKAELDKLDKFLAAQDKYDRQLDALAQRLGGLHKVSQGHYQISSHSDHIGSLGKRYDDKGQKRLHANIHRGSRYGEREKVSKWYADVRYSDGSGLYHNMGSYKTRREATHAVLTHLVPKDKLPVHSWWDQKLAMPTVTAGKRRRIGM